MTGAESLKEKFSKCLRDREKDESNMKEKKVKV